jgi:chromosome segregation ATPase
MDIMDSMERKETYQQYYDEREARLKKLGLAIEQWEPKEDQATQEEVDDYYQTVGRLESRLEATRSRLEELSEARDDEGLRARIDKAITELEEAVAQAAPRFQ